MNVSRSIDWERMTPLDLDGHRFIGQLRSGATLDSHLLRAKKNVIFDADRLAVVMYKPQHGVMRLEESVYRSINVLEETK
ncbi:hypothetical protein [Bifidobacterium tibiigranuli]|jgi:hypothetical protein|uniref:hypothetical protein n=1 Tax=Bifidobacterium tibiigranuli TaxID=2172043 RepID=UPI0023559224|nr:hypothetical protein [Bifidobacterium tibiigranuli]MCH3975043.1 hypothetical protein [Bifidobacterium tibiigranuli]MCH4202803.1 hypothetical protein [Bifidobacterium tibiigranuli]MCH4274945.1 hypothetical protein [Bifidobacterium tibiigranuli]MCI1211032.1 hypothetical protein [Bifidobacterium tibiigranuli]MCI1221797.1 hypothetical protein [Bifidobacterium tibiigranuli]